VSGLSAATAGEETSLCFFSIAIKEKVGIGVENILSHRPLFLSFFVFLHSYISETSTSVLRDFIQEFG